jgi:hypothetical protein
VVEDMRTARLPWPKNALKVIVLYDNLGAEATPKAVVPLTAQVVSVIEVGQRVRIVDLMHVLKMHAEVPRIIEDVMAA